MGYDYDKLYDETPDALGPPTNVFVEFFARLDRTGARILDLGCGQGRDAIFIARAGHHVVGVDISANGIRDLTTVAKRDDLPVKGIVADITDFTPEGAFDIILIDRTLHMLDRDTRNRVLRGLLDHVATGGWLLIADERANIPDFETVIAADGASWTIEFPKKSILFAHRD